MHTFGPDRPDFDIFMEELDDDFELEFQDRDDALETPGRSLADASDDMNVELESDRESSTSLNKNEDDKPCESSDEMASESDLETRPSTPPVIEHIEKMVIAFLTQLAFPGKGKQEDQSDGHSSESDEEAPEKRRRKYSVEIHLADRKKMEVDG